MFTLQVTDDIYLRMLSARDAEDLFRLTDDSRTYLKKWLPWLDHTKTEEDSLEFIKSTFYTYNNRKGITAGVFLHDQLAGVVGFNHLDFNHNIGTIGYWLGEDFQGKGIMTKAVSALVTYGFIDLQLNRIEIRVATENFPSQAIPERLQFTKEGTLRQAEKLENKYVDHILYSMLKSEWKQI